MELKETLKEMYERFSNPLFASFIFCWVIINWEPSMRLIYFLDVDKDPFILNDFICEFKRLEFSFWKPLGFAILYTALIPYIKMGVDLVKENAAHIHNIVMHKFTENAYLPKSKFEELNLKLKESEDRTSQKSNELQSIRQMFEHKVIELSKLKEDQLQIDRDYRTEIAQNDPNCMNGSYKAGKPYQFFVGYNMDERKIIDFDRINILGHNINFQISEKPGNNLEGNIRSFFKDKNSPKACYILVEASSKYLKISPGKLPKYFFFLVWDKENEDFKFKVNINNALEISLFRLN